MLSFIEIQALWQANTSYTLTINATNECYDGFGLQLQGQVIDFLTGAILFESPLNDIHPLIQFFGLLPVPVSTFVLAPAEFALTVPLETAYFSTFPKNFTVLYRNPSCPDLNITLAPVNLGNMADILASSVSNLDSFLTASHSVNVHFRSSRLHFLCKIFS
jgi:hypothetical protein